MIYVQDSGQPQTVASESQELPEEEPLDTSGLTPVEDEPLDLSQFGTPVDAQEFLDGGPPLVPDYSAADLVAGTILAYGLPLLVAAVIRFGIRRRPLSKGIAALIAAILWICTYSVFFVLHSAAGLAREWTSRPHAALFIAAAIAYYVLRARGRATDGTQTATEPPVENVSTHRRPRRNYWPNRRMVFGVVIALMLLFPPWTSEQIAYSGKATISSPAGYAFIATPPKSYSRSVSIQLDLWRLVVQLGAVASIWVAIHGSRLLRRDEPPSESES